MPRIECIEDKGGTSPKDFTLHDSGHGFRVADWMVRIIPDDVLPKLSKAELMLLLLSAYLHDIGMSPEWGKVDSHLRYLSDGSIEMLRPEDLSLFQVWLAEQQGLGFKPPVSDSGLIRQLLTYYCRARHNDWGTEWIEQNLPETGPYHAWRDDLVAICRSHHYGFDELASSVFEVRRLGPDLLVHRRYLAVALRVADVLENDPERTPDVLLRHRGVSKSSRIHWQKTSVLHQELSNGRLLLSAEPPTAIMHRAVEETADAIDFELSLCNRISRELPFNYDRATGGSLPHYWNLAPHSIRNIRPAAGKYEYINGSFRPNTSRLLDLLTGSRLYGSAFAAVRELIQNAFDSVREQIAREQISRRRYDPAYAQAIADKHSVELRFEVGSEAARLICTDTGAGMSKDIITNRLLISGSGPDRQAR
jgi:hypothetical protein